MTIPPGQQDPYRNKKQGLSQNVMVACDFDMKFVHVHAGWEGSASSDARVLQDALDHGFNVPPGNFYLVDAGYANTPQFIAPYQGTRYHLRKQGRVHQRPQCYKELFNLRHAQLRDHVERIIGILKARYPILKAATMFDIDTQVDIVVACCVLHNFIRLHNGDMTLPDRATTDTNESTMKDVPGGDAKYKKDVILFNNLRQAGNEMRDAMAMQMWADYIARR
uniref:DDE Tnp4 domain-containing protein n=2 Tax=Hordeum vulgare subsp. vulgare TaxID=112509 RepID=A0A8I7BC18_HORVV